VDVDLDPVFLAVIPFRFFSCVSWWKRVAKENQRSGMLDEKKTDGMLERWKTEQLRSF
jgi:hypothetical protein